MCIIWIISKLRHWWHIHIRKMWWGKCRYCNPTPSCKCKDCLEETFKPYEVGFRE